MEISTAAEKRAISSSVSCREHKLLAKSKTALTKSSQPWRGEEWAGERSGLKMPLLSFFYRKRKSTRCKCLTKGFKHLHASVLSFKEDRVVERVESPAHPHQNYLQTTWENQRGGTKIFTLLFSCPNLDPAALVSKPVLSLRSS